MALLEPDWNQPKPTPKEAQEMCGQVVLEPLTTDSEAIARTLDRLRATHLNGGAILKAVRVGDSTVFDWFASRNRLLEYGILTSLLHRSEIRESLPDLSIPSDPMVFEDANDCGAVSSGGFKFDNPFLFDAHLSFSLFAGGAYRPSEKINAKAAKRLALDFCEAVFDQRYEEVLLYNSQKAWTPWFQGIAWDWTAVLFDRGTRILWILAVTDID